MKIIKNYNDEVKGSIEGIKLYHELVKAALKSQLHLSDVHKMYPVSD